MQNYKSLLFIIASIMMQLQYSYAQKDNTNEYNTKLSILAGLIQPMVLKGGNIEATYFTKRLTFDYSHGFLLNIGGPTTTGDAKEQKLKYHLPFSTGFGIGYRFTPNFDVRAEYKTHSWQVYYEGENQNSENRITAYKTYTVGIGAYYVYMPFKKKDNWLRGITISNSVRWWPNVGSSLTDNKFSYYNKLTEKNEVLNASNIGITGTQFLVNVSIGYTFEKKKQ